MSDLDEFYEAASTAIENQELDNYIDPDSAVELSRLFDAALVATTSSLEDTTDAEIDEQTFRSSIVRLQMIAFLAGLAAGNASSAADPAAGFDFSVTDSATTEIVKALLRDGRATINIVISDQVVDE